MKYKFAILLLLLSTLAMAQVVAYTGTPYVSLNAASSTVPGTVYALQPSVYSYTWTVATGEPVTSATVNLEGSLDGSTWYVLDIASTSDSNWSAGEMRHVVNKPANYLRLNLVSIAGGGSITGKISLFR